MAAYNREAPSARYQELLTMYKTAHAEGLSDQNISAEDCFPGSSLAPHVAQIRKLIVATGARNILDYGSGKGAHYKATNIKLRGIRAKSIRDYWDVDTVTCYDPAYPPYSVLPEGTFDGVICTDVLEHIPDTDLPWILGEQFRFARKFVFGNIASYPAQKILPNGENAHCTIQPAAWWDNLVKSVVQDVGSHADYLFLVETKKKVTKFFGLKTKLLPEYVYISSRTDWPP